MYRRALAASWASQAGELPADQCVEEIFAGGDGWKPDWKATPKVTQGTVNVSGEDLHRHHRTQSGASSKSQNTITGKGSGRFGHKHSRSKNSIGDAAAIQHSPNETSSDGSERGRSGGFRKAHEVDEFEIRDNLVAWRLSDKVFV